VVGVVLPSLLGEGPGMRPEPVGYETKFSHNGFLYLLSLSNSMSPPTGL